MGLGEVSRRRWSVVAVGVSIIGSQVACFLLPSLDGFATGPVDGGLGDQDGFTTEPMDGGRGDGSCGDVLTSPKHCGACGHDCLESACSGGVCTPKVVVAGLRGVRLSVVNGMAYYLDEGASSFLRRVAVGGGFPESFPMQCARPWSEMAVGAQYAFYGCNVVMVRHRTTDLTLDGKFDYQGPLSPEQVVGDTLYFNRNGAILMAPATQLDAFVTVKPISVKALRTIRVVGGQAFYVVDGDAGSIGQVSIDGGIGGPIATSVRPKGLAVDDVGVVWTDEAEGGTVWSQPLTGGKPAGVMLARAKAVALGGAYIYATVHGVGPEEGSIVRLRRDGSEPAVELARGEFDPLAIALDDTFVYWTTAGPQPPIQTGDLRRVAR